VEAAVRHGAALPGDVDRLQVEILRLEAGIAGNRSEQQAALDALSVWIQAPVEPDATLVLPTWDETTMALPAQRVETRLFDLQKQRIAASEALIDAGKKPKLSAWAQAGLGYPNPFNFFDNELSPFGAVGLAFTWRIHDWKQSVRDRELLSLQMLGIDNQSAAFDRQLEAREMQLRRQIEDTARLLAKDEEIIALQARISAQVEAQLERGTATATDFIEQQNALTQAQLALQNRRMQWQLLRVNLLTLKGLL
jgi:outer membrane protein TolC